MIKLEFTCETAEQAGELIEAYGKIKNGVQTYAATIDPGHTLDDVDWTAPAANADGNYTQRDNEGVPFNADYHSSNQKLTAEGRWRARRGVDPVAAEAWRAQHTKPVPTVAPALATQAPTNVVPLATNAAAGGVPAPTEPNPFMVSAPASTFAPIPPLGAPIRQVTLDEWNAVYMAHYNSGKMTQEGFDAMNAATGGDMNAYMADGAARARSVDWMAANLR